MNQDEIKKLAIECGTVKHWQGDGAIVFISAFTFTTHELVAYTAAVEAPLQARIAQLEEALSKRYRGKVENDYYDVDGLIG